MTTSKRPGGLTEARRLLAEATRHDEAARGAPPAEEEAAALARGRAMPGPIEAKVVARAEALPGAGRLAQELDRLRALLRATLLVALAISALAGAATARTALASADGTTVNFFWMLAGLLGLHLASFLAWCGLMSAAPGFTQGGVLGATLLWLWRKAATRLDAGRPRAAAVQAVVGRWGRGGAGRWLASSLGHGIWTGYLLGALVMTLMLLGAQRYHFVWETTILSATAYVRMTTVLSALPRAFGIAVPDRAAVIGAEWPDQVAAGDEAAWSSLLIACIVLYGLLPRLLALLTSLLFVRRAAGATPLDLSRPGYARLVPFLSPEATATSMTAADTRREPRLGDLPDLGHMPTPPPAGPVVVLGWEIEAPATGWPPPVAADHLRDLGRLDGRADLERAAGVMERASRTPARVVVVVDFRHTPDRGIAAVLGRLQAVAGDRLFLLLSGAAALHRRLAAADARDRLADWVAAGRAANIGLERMVAIDLDDLSGAERERLARLLGANW